MQAGGVGTLDELGDSVNGVRAEVDLATSMLDLVIWVGWMVISVEGRVAMDDDGWVSDGWLCCVMLCCVMLCCVMVWCVVLFGMGRLGCVACCCVVLC
jgi:hypothetical protein